MGDAWRVADDAAQGGAALPGMSARGERGLHKVPLQTMVRARRPWLDEELARTKPAVVVCLGAYAAHALLGRDVRVTEAEGHLYELDSGAVALATIHPSVFLRTESERAADAARDRLVAGLVRARALARKRTSRTARAKPRAVAK